MVVGGGALLPGLCARLGQEIRSLAKSPNPAVSTSSSSSTGEYAWARAAISGEASSSGIGAVSSEGAGRVDGDGKGLCVVRCPAGVERSLLLWTGASIMATLGGVNERSLTTEQYLTRSGGVAGGGGGGAARLPDWMSISPSDWLFSAPPAAIGFSANVA